jgi:hypothetical protein
VPPWLKQLSLAWVLLGFATAIATAVDVWRHRQRMPIMNIVWPVTGLYLPLAAWWCYRLMGRAARRASGPPPPWQAAFVSSTHCGSGCVLGDAIGAPLVLAGGWALAGQRLFAEYVVEFTLAYLFGVVFQYFSIRGMRPGSRRAALGAALKADTLSLLAFEVGMFAWMALVHYLLLPGREFTAATIPFWFMMQIAMTLGLISAYPANWLLIRWGVKQAM